MPSKGKIRVTQDISVDASELDWDFVRASGPGGQNVNKAATAVQLRFDAKHSPSLPEDARERLVCLAGKRVTADGILIIDARRYRSQEQNRQDAIDRLVELIRKASIKPKTRRPTKPTLASRQKRLEEKRRRSELKRTRKSISDLHDES
jgi:ribosome-associated protein